MGNEQAPQRQRSHIQNPQEIASSNDNFVHTYSKLINMGFNENIALKAATKYPSDVNKAMNYIVKITKNKIPQQFECVEIKIIVECRRNPEYSSIFDLSVPYSMDNKYSLKQIIKDVMEYVHQQHNPIKFVAKKITKNSFINKELSDNDDDWRIWDDIYITNYSKHDIKTNGLYICSDIAIYEHRVSSMNITCYNTLSNKTDEHMNAFSCSIYAQMKNEQKFTQDNLQHLHKYNHFKNEYSDKDECKFGDECYTFKRLQLGGNKLEDRCHIKLYRHPPRTRTKLNSSPEINSFCLNNGWSENESLYKPTQDDKKEFEYNEKDGYLKALIKEVIDNGFRSDLFVAGDDPNDEKDDDYSLLQVVENKLNCVRHKQMGSPLNRAEMLSIILYTSSDCNYDLCSVQRDRDYKKWKWFDYCLYNAIYKLSKREFGRYKLYTGLARVQLDYKYIDSGYFTTYVSTSWIKDIALRFVEGEGMMFEIAESFREKAVCADVSWISKFGVGECEVLIARSIDAVYNNFECKVSDNNDGIQTVLLSQYGAHNTVTSIISTMNGRHMNVVHSDDKPLNDDDIVIQDHAAENVRNRMKQIRLKQEERDIQYENVGLDDDDKTLFLKSGGEKSKLFEISLKCVMLSKFVITVLEGDPDTETIEIRQVPPETLAQVVTYLKHHKGKEPDPLPCPVRSIHMSQIVSDKWDAIWIDAFDKKTIFEIILAANYMDIKSLLHLGCAKIATLTKQLDQKEINRIIEEEEKYRREHAQDNEAKTEEKDDQ